MVRTKLWLSPLPVSREFADLAFLKRNFSAGELSPPTLDQVSPEQGLPRA